MVLQNIEFPADGFCEKEIYVRGFSVPDCPKEACTIRKGEAICTDTYMNAFDIGAWKKYTDIADLTLVWRCRGKGTLEIYWEKENKAAVCLTEMIIDGQRNASEEIRYCFENFGQLSEGILYLKYYAITDSLAEAWYETESLEKRDVNISIVICTYKRKKQLEQLINIVQRIIPDMTLETTGCRAAQSTRVSWLRTVIVDNASELTDRYGEGITVYHNPNFGGSGGFARGMKETVRNLPEFQTTHVVLMDDDVILREETIRRLHALLTYIRPEYEQETVAGRMFRMDRPHIQYTAAEIWNSGDLRHIGWNQDMTDRQNLWTMNDNEGGEYSGWWFACYPIDFIKTNEPLPFFLHCDDVEYGLRHGGTPILLNGIQVWHETYEYRQSPVTVYYDCRNSLIVNSIYAGRTTVRKNLNQVLQAIAEMHARQDYLREYYLMRAYRDFLKGEKWFFGKNNETLHTSLIKKKKRNRYVNHVRRVEIKFYAFKTCRGWMPWETCASTVWE